MCSSTQGANVTLQGDVLCLATHLAHYSTSSCARVLSPFSRVQLCAALWTAAARLLCQWNSPGKKTGVGCHAPSRYMSLGMGK